MALEIPILSRALESSRYGRPGASEAGAQAAHVEQFVLPLPDGYAAEVGERGVRLSGGQRQPLAIWSTILKDSLFLLRDEAASALDADCERAVRSAQETAMRGRTTILIALGLPTAQRVDRICVLDRGRPVDSGTHAELVARSRLQARLAGMQFAG
jgi:ATP-binding cassette subfamily B protein